MSVAAIDTEPLDATSLTWTVRLIEWWGVSPLTFGAALVLCDLALFFAYFQIVGNEGPEFWRRIAAPTAQMALLLGFASAVGPLIRRNDLRGLADLRPLLDCDDEEFSRLRSAVGGFNLRAMRWIGVVQVLLFPTLVVLDPVFRESRPEFGLRDPLLYWIWFNNAVVVWFGSRHVFHDVRGALLYSRIGRDHVGVDLMNPGALAPFARRGLFSVLLMSVGVALFSTIFLIGSATYFAPLIYLVLLPLLLLGLWLPLRGVRQRIVETKQRDSARLSAEIAAERRAFERRGTDDAREAATRLPALLALLDATNAAREWPVDLSTFLRFALYAMIGLGSWFGGALVERLVDAFLG